MAYIRIPSIRHVDSQMQHFPLLDRYFSSIEQDFGSMKFSHPGCVLVMVYLVRPRVIYDYLLGVNYLKVYEEYQKFEITK
jgi:hypothetical protein